MRFKRKERGKKLKYWVIAILALLVVGSAGWAVIVKYEGENPQIQLDLKNAHFGADTEVSGAAIDRKSGIRKIWIAVMQDGAETVLKDTVFSESDIIGTAGKIDMAPFTVSLNTKQLGLSDGKALLRLAVWDCSWRNWFSGNRTYLEKNIVIDTTSPQIAVLSRQHNVSRGGSGLVIYRLSEDCQKHGVYVGDHFFQGHAGYFSDPEVCLAFFAVAQNQSADVELYAAAEDIAGNVGRSGFYHHLRNRRFDAETLTISDRFLKKILPEFQDVSGLDPQASLLDQFLFINRQLRKQNNVTILASGERTDSQRHWKGVFDRLPNSARKASYADHRTYVYNGDVVDEQVHMGIDLASTRQAPVPAANDGRVAFVGRVGIYGNTVTIDHGLGVFTVYAHLSRTSVTEGQSVSKSDIVGYTGTTGLAGGDHLHYAVFIQDVFVNPVEWWDATWIQNNIDAKIEQVAAILNE